MTDLVDRIPATPPTHWGPQSPGQPVARVNRFAIPYRDVYNGRVQEVQLAPCEWVRIMGSHALNVYVDGEQVMTELNVEPMVAFGQTRSFNPQNSGGAGGIYDSTGLKPWRAFGAFDVTVRRPCRTLALNGTPPATEDNLPGCVYVWIGSGPTDAPDWGVPIFHVVSADTQNPGPVYFLNEPIRIALHGNNIADGVGNLLYVPQRTLITNVSINVSFQGAIPAGGLACFYILQMMRSGAPASWFSIKGGYFTMTASTYEWEYSTPIEVFPYQHRVRAVMLNPGGALSVAFFLGAPADAVQVFLNCQSWL